MKTKGRKAWLITWEGDKAGEINRPKVVAALPPQLRERSLEPILELLYHSEYPFLTLCEKIGFGLAPKSEKPRFLRYAYRDINPELHYGDFHCFLSVRMVKNLICKETGGYPCECTLSWTELAKFRCTDDSMEKSKTVAEEKEGSYTTKHS